MLEKKSRRSTIIIAGALFVSPLAVAAFRTPSHHAHLQHQPQQLTPILAHSSERSSLDFGSSTTIISHRSSSNSASLIRRHSSILSHGSDAERQQSSAEPPGKSPLLNGNAAENGGASSNGADIKFDKQQTQHKNGKNQPYKLKNFQSTVDGSAKVLISKKNPAMTDLSFLRKRTKSLLHANTAIANKKVDKRTFDWLIDGWAHSGEVDAANMALALLNRMEEMRDAAPTSMDGNGNGVRVSPDARSYTKVISAISRSGRKTAGEEAESILNRMIEHASSNSMLDSKFRPNTITYTYVIDAYAHSPTPQSPYDAQRLVEKMEQLRSQGDSEVRPTARAWNSVIGAWAQWEGGSQGEASGAEHAEACLKIMEELANSTGNEEVRPNSYNYNSVISAWANSREIGAPSRAEQILEKMESLYRASGDENVKPRTATYNAIIDAWAKSGEEDTANRAELLLGHMMELYETGHNVDAKPNVRSFNSVLNAWAKSGDAMAPVRASEVLERMVALSAENRGDKEEGGLDVSPDATSFATVINAYGRSYAYGKAQAAYELFQHMKELYDASGNESLRPNYVVYNSVLNACAFTMGDLEEQSRAMEIASSMLVGLEESPYGKPDQVTYGTYLKVIANQMPASKARAQIVEAVFRKCARVGMVGDFVLRQLKDMSIKGSTYKKLVGKSVDEVCNLSDLPSSWTCNVIEGKKMRRRQFRRS